MHERLLGSVYRKTIRDWLLWTIIAVATLWGVSALYIGLMASSGDLYVSMIADMPEALSNIYGRSDGTAAGLAMSGIFFLMGPMVLLTYVIGLGSSAAVGEEEAGTLPILLASPLRRRSILVAKTSVAAIGALIIILAMWAGVQLLASIFGMDLSSQGTFAAAVQLAGMVLFFGALALGISAWRGSSALGIGVAAGLALVSYFITTLLPVVDQLADLARLTPWYLLSGADALSRGVDVVLLAIALSLAAVLFGAGAYALDRRDLKG
jgi:ABC-2 type transport system permease protein